jgi:putative ABC transport system permease protein
MRLVRLALADLFSERVHLVCTIAMIVGVVVPLGILLGVKTGVFAALMDNLRADREILRVAIPYNTVSFTAADAEEVRGWPETAFVAVSSRSVALKLNVKKVGGNRIREANLIPTGPGDPVLPPGVVPQGMTVAVAGPLADILDIAPGDRLLGALGRGSPVTDRLALDFTVAQVLPRAALGQEALLVDPQVIDRIEAFIDGYALPDWGVEAGRPLAGRVERYESLRVYARDLEDVAPLEARIRQRFEVITGSQAARVAGLLALGRNLDLALSLVASAALGGLFAALLSSFWAMVQRKRLMLATLGLVGVTPAGLALVPVVQAAAAALMGALASLLLLGAFAQAAQWLFAGALPAGASVIRLAPLTLLGIVVGTVTLAVLAAFLAARSAARLDPAITIREGQA